MPHFRRVRKRRFAGVSPLSKGDTTGGICEGVVLCTLGKVLPKREESSTPISRPFNPGNPSFRFSLCPIFATLAARCVLSLYSANNLCWRPFCNPIFWALATVLFHCLLTPLPATAVLKPFSPSFLVVPPSFVASRGEFKRLDVGRAAGPSTFCSDSKASGLKGGDSQTEGGSQGGGLRIGGGEAQGLDCPARKCQLSNI